MHERVRIQVRIMRCILKMADVWNERLLFGRRKDARRRVILASFLLLVISSAYFYLLTSPEMALPRWLQVFSRWEYYVCFAVLVVTALGIYESGLVLSWAVAFSLFFGMIANGGGIGNRKLNP